MAWVESDKTNGDLLKPVWEYRKGVEFVTILPDTTRDFALLTGDLDPTKSWPNPVEAWIHQFKTQKGFATVVCDKWNEACPFCYENEKFKLANPNYKNEKKQLPYPISSKGLLQVYDFQEKRVLWLIAGQKIIEGMEFILTRQAAQFKGYVAITRIGSKLNTSYRVDISHVSLSPADLIALQSQVQPISNWRKLMSLSHQEVIEKTAIDPIAYFAHNLPMKHAIDISKWGKVPSGVVDSPIGCQIPDAPIAQNAPQPAQAPQQTDLPTPMGSIPLQQAVGTKCTQGIYQGKTFGEIFVQTGKSYMQFIAQAGSTVEEKQAAMAILTNWDEAIKIADQTKGAF